MVFNLTKERHFKNKGTGREIFSSIENGPNFGGAELCAYYEPFNGDSNCLLHSNQDCYCIPSKNDEGMLSN
jgi:hypothetical protein